MPDFEDKDALASWIDLNICAEFPTQSSDSSYNEILYAELVEK